MSVVLPLLFSSVLLQNGPDAQQIDRVVRAQVDSGFRGVVIVAQHDSVVSRRAYGTTVDRPFWIASITKSFTAAAIQKLASAHRLAVSDSIVRFLPDAPADKRNITIQQLITHTAGLGGTYTGGGITDRTSAVRAILSQKLIHSPGAGYQYGDDDYELLAAIVEVVSGMSWEDFVDREIVRPAGLRNTGFACRSNSAIPSVACDWGHKGANGISATADDVLRWARASKSPLDRTSILVRKEPPFDVWYGDGVRIYKRDGQIAEIMHAGSGDNGHTAVARVMRSGLIVVVLSDAGQHGGTTWSSYIAQKLATRD